MKEALVLLDRARERADQIGPLQGRPRAAEDGLPLARLRTAENRSYVLLRLWDPSTAQIWVREFPGFRVAELPFHSRLLAQQLCAALLIAGELGEAASLIAPARRPLLEGMLAFRLGDWDRAQTIWSEGLSRCEKAGARDPASDYLASLADLHLARGQHASAESLLLQSLAAALDAPQVQLELHTRGSLGRLYAEMDRDDEARAHLARCREILSEGEDWRGLRGHVDRSDAVQTACGGNLEAASNHFSDAATIFRRYTLPWEEAETLHLWGRALVKAGETAHASEKFDAAIEIYKCHGGGQRWIDRVEAERARICAASIESIPDPTDPDDASAVFQREGDFWTIAYRGTTLRLKHSKGLAYLATLLCNPNREFHALELVIDPASYRARQTDREQEIAARGRFDESGMHVNGPGDAGPMLDRVAREAYAHRLAELRETIEDARETNNDERIAEAEDEIEQLSRELSHSVGLGGRARVASSPVERARLSVWHAIKSALDKIAVGNPDLGRLLSTTIKTGSICVYRPDPRFPILWQF